MRRQYCGYLKESAQLDDQHLIVEEDKKCAEEQAEKGCCQNLTLYRYENMVFLYLETSDEALGPEELLPALSEKLEWRSGLQSAQRWMLMRNVYYHAEYKEEKWQRTGEKIKRGRIARLLPDKWASYLYFHLALVREGLLEGDQYQYISLYDDILFSYYEEPKIMTHIRAEVPEASKVIEQWEQEDPESHFDHELSGKGNFLYLEEVFAVESKIPLK